MVLSNASDPKADSGFDDVLPADQDRYNSDNMGDSHFNSRAAISDSSLPQPCPGTSMLGFTNENLAKLVDVRIKQAQNIMKRPPSQEEASALAYWTAKQVSIISYGTPIGTAAGLYRAYSSAAGFQFPFIKPDFNKFNPDVFITQRLKVFEGARARYAWHALRMAAYGAGGNFIGQLLFASYAMSVIAVGELSDKRLKDYVQDMKRMAETAQGKVRERTGQTVPQAPAEGQQGPSGQAPGLFGRRQPQKVEDVDDASPTGGAFWEGNDNNLAEKAWKDAGDPSKDHISRRVDRDSGRRQKTYRQSYSDDGKNDVDDGTALAKFDDSSPSGEMGAQEDSGSGSESAWERLRRESGGK